MPDTLDNSLLACKRAIDDMILPAIDPANPLAAEQAQLVSRTLSLALSQLPWLHAKARRELAINRACAARVAEAARAVDPSLVARLEAGFTRAQDLLADPAAFTADIRACTAELATLISLCVQACQGLDTPAARAVERAAIQGSTEVIELHRAWFLPTGFDTDPGSVPALDTLLGAARPND